MSRKRKLNVGDDDLDGYDSNFEDDQSEAGEERRAKRTDLTDKDPAPNIVPSGTSKGLPTKEYFHRELTRAESYRNRYFALNAYERHRKLVNEYFLYHRGAADKVLKRDSSRDKTDSDIIRENHRFLWDDEGEPDTWEKQLAKRYYDKLFKEYCICDLSRYKEKKVAMRWRTENELVEGKGQFTCGARKCDSKEGLRTWEVNFAYVEDSVKKNALVKLRLCPDCSIKLNYGRECREVVKKVGKKSKKKSSKHHKKDRRSSSKDSSKKHRRRTSEDSSEDQEPSTSSSIDKTKEDPSKSPDNIWKEPLAVPEMKSREEEFEDYLDDLFI